VPWLCGRLLTSLAVAHHVTPPQMLSSDASEANSSLNAFTQHLYDDDAGKCMHSTLIAMGQGQFGFTISSFRAGGATHYATTGVDIHRLKFWGRWASEKSLTSYIQEACAHTIMSQIGSKLTQRLEAFVSANSFVRAPPHKPWQYYLLRA
jgi:hypothetical protein